MCITQTPESSSEQCDMRPPRVGMSGSMYRHIVTNHTVLAHNMNGTRCLHPAVLSQIKRVAGIHA